MLLASQTFAITPADSMATLVVGLVAAVIFAIDGFLFYLLSRVGNATFTVEGGALRIDAPIYGRTIPKASLKLGEARVVRLAEETELQPVLRTNGVGLPGMKVGWFKLRNKQKGLIFVGPAQSALYIPTTEDFVLLLQPEQPEQLLSALRS
jgi:hypothetical protein